MTKKARSAALDERARKIGEREETITVELTPEQIEDEKGRVCDLLGRKDNLLASIKSLKADYKAKVDNVDERIAAARQAAATGKRDEEIVVEEWLTRDNRVLRIRADTGEQIGAARIARPEELQEVLFEDKDDNKDDKFPSAEAVFGGSA